MALLEGLEREEADAGCAGPEVLPPDRDASARPGSCCPLLPPCPWRTRAPLSRALRGALAVLTAAGPVETAGLTRRLQAGPPRVQQRKARWSACCEQDWASAPAQKQRPARGQLAAADRGGGKGSVAGRVNSWEEPPSRDSPPPLLQPHPRLWGLSARELCVPLIGLFFFF